MTNTKMPKIETYQADHPLRAKGGHYKTSKPCTEIIMQEDHCRSIPATRLLRSRRPHRQSNWAMPLHEIQLATQNVQHSCWASALCRSQWTAIVTTMRDYDIDFLFLTEVGQPPRHHDTVFHVGLEEFTMVTTGFVGILMKKVYYQQWQARGGQYSRLDDRWLALQTKIRGRDVNLVTSYAPTQYDREAREQYLLSGAEFLLTLS